MAIDGHAADAWNWQKHFAVQQAVHGPALTELYAWHYPPPFLLVAAALSTLPYLPSLLLWQGTSLLAFTLMMGRLVPGRNTLLLTVSAPATFICATHGQNGFLTALLLGSGLLLVERRPFAAGLLFGCLIYKPQFGIVLPVMMLAGRHWKTIGGAFTAATLLFALTVVLWGWPVWQAFFDSLPLTRTVIVENGAAGFHKIVSPFAAARLWGGSISLAYVAQFIATVLTIVAVTRVSRSIEQPSLRNSLICAAAVISAPYAIDYDLVILLPALAWLYIDGRTHGFMRWDRTLMALVWISPLFARPAAQFAHVPLGLLGALVVAAITCRRFIWRERGTGMLHSPA